MTFVDAGALASYGASFPDLYRRTAFYVDKSLPSDHSVQTVTRLCRELIGVD